MARAERRHVIVMALGGEVGIVPLAVQWIFGDACAEPALLIVEDGDADAERSEINAGDNRAHALCQYISQPRYSGRGFIDDVRNGGEVGGRVVFESAFADEAQQILQSWNFDYACAAEGVQRNRR